MKKFVLTTLVSLFVITSSYAQAYEDKIEYNKVKQACLTIEYNYPPAAVENAIITKLDKLGYKGKEEKGMFNKDKGFRVYKDALISDISSSRYDYVINIDKKSRKDDDESVLYLIIMKAGNNALSKLNGRELGHARSFLDDLLPDIEAANLELQITAQEEAVSKAEKKLKSLQDDKDEMEKKIKKLESDLEDNKKDQEKQKDEIENQRKSLEELKNKRKYN